MSAGFWQYAIASWGYWPWALIGPVYLYSQLRGDSSARGFGGVLAIAALLGTLLAWALPEVPLARGDRLGLDALLLAAQVGICLRTHWLYPIPICAGQLLVTLTEALAASGFALHPGALEILFAVLAALQLSAFAAGLALHRNRRPLWRVRARRENAPAELAPRANGAR